MMTDEADSLVTFARLRDDAAALLRRAAALPDLPAHYRAQAIAAAKLASLVLHRGYGEPTPDDALALRDDLDTLARCIVDPLIAVIGAEANSLIGGIDESLFADQLLGALEGNALYVLDRAADTLKEAEREFAADRRGWAKAKFIGVD